MICGGMPYRVLVSCSSPFIQGFGFLFFTFYIGFCFLFFIGYVGYYFPVLEYSFKGYGFWVLPILAMWLIFPSFVSRTLTQGRHQQIWAPQLRPYPGPLGYLLPTLFPPSYWKHPLLHWSSQNPPKPHWKNGKFSLLVHIPTASKMSSFRFCLLNRTIRLPYLSNCA